MPHPAAALAEEVAVLDGAVVEAAHVPAGGDGLVDHRRAAGTEPHQAHGRAAVTGPSAARRSVAAAVGLQPWRSASAPSRAAASGIAHRARSGAAGPRRVGPIARGPQPRGGRGPAPAGRRHVEQLAPVEAAASRASTGTRGRPGRRAGAPARSGASVAADGAAAGPASRPTGGAVGSSTSRLCSGEPYTGAPSAAARRDLDRASRRHLVAGDDGHRADQQGGRPSSAAPLADVDASVAFGGAGHGRRRIAPGRSIRSAVNTGPWAARRRRTPAAGSRPSSPSDRTSWLHLHVGAASSTRARQQRVGQPGGARPAGRR